MQGILKNSITNLKYIFAEAPFLGWFVVYIFFISIKWQSLKPWLSQHSSISQLILLSIIPIVLWCYEKHKKLKAHKKRIATFRESRILPKHDIDRLKNLLPDSQIDLFESVLLPSLSMFYASFSEIGQEEYYKQKLESLCNLISQLRKNTGLYANSPQHKYRDIALTAFSFYRALFNGAIEVFNKHAVSKTDQTDSWVLLKRVPAKLSLILGAEYWRLYEFWQAVYGDINKLELNKNITTFMACGMQDNEPTADSLLDKTSTSQIAEQFIDWLKANISANKEDYVINSGKYIFMDKEHFESSVFISEKLLQRYQNIKKISLNEIKEALLAADFILNKSYQIEVDGKPLALMCMKDFSIEHKDINPVTITEVNNNG